MSEQLPFLFGALAHANEKEIASIYEEIANESNKVDTPGWYQGPTVPFEWEEGTYCRLYVQAVGSVEIVAMDVATAGGIVHEVGIHSSGGDDIAPARARSYAADLCRAADILDRHARTGGR